MCGPGTPGTRVSAPGAQCRQCIQHKSHSNSAANQLDVQSNGDLPQSCDYDNLRARGTWETSAIFALSPTKQNVITFVSFVTPSKVKFKNIYKCQNQSWEDVIQTLGGGEGKQSAPSRYPDPPVMIFPSHNYFYGGIERLCLVTWMFVMIFCASFEMWELAGVGAMLCMFPEFPGEDLRQGICSFLCRDH